MSRKVPGYKLSLKIGICLGIFVLKSCQKSLKSSSKSRDFEIRTPNFGVTDPPQQAVEFPQVLTSEV